MNSLLEKHLAYMDKWKADKKPVAAYICPACGKEIETTRPSRGECAWTTAASCPYCEDVRFLIVPASGKVRVKSLETP